MLYFIVSQTVKALLAHNNELQRYTFFSSCGKNFPLWRIFFVAQQPLRNPTCCLHTHIGLYETATHTIPMNVACKEYYDFPLRLLQLPSKEICEQLVQIQARIASIDAMVLVGIDTKLELFIRFLQSCKHSHGVLKMHVVIAAAMY